MARAIENPLAQGFYTVPEAARLIQVGSTRRIHGWLRGYPRREIGPLLTRDYEPLDDYEELSFLDLMEVRFVEHFRDHGVRVRSLRIAAQRLKEEFKISHPFALDRVHLVADKADIFVEEVFRQSAEQAGDTRLRSLLTKNYVMYEVIKRGLLPGISFDPRSHLAQTWAPIPDRFPKIIVNPRVAYGQPAGESGIPTRTLFDAWKSEKEDVDAVAYWFEIATTDVLDAVKFEVYLDGRHQEQVA